MYTQTQEKAAPPPPPLMSKSESAPGSSFIVKKVLAREMEDDSLLQPDTQYFADASGSGDSADCHSSRRLPLGRLLTPVQVSSPDNLSAPLPLDKPTGVVASTCFGRQVTRFSLTCDVVTRP